MHYVEKDGVVTVEPGRHTPTKVVAIVGRFPEGPLTVVAGGGMTHLDFIRDTAARWVEVHPLGEHEELRILLDITNGDN